MKETQEKPVGLPENAFRSAEAGRNTNPSCLPDKTYPEVNLWSVSMGTCAWPSFSRAAAAYLGPESGTGV